MGADSPTGKPKLPPKKGTVKPVLGSDAANPLADRLVATGARPAAQNPIPAAKPNKPAAPAATQPQELEDKILSIPHLQELISGPAAPKSPKIYTQFLEQIAPKIALRPTSSAILGAFVKIDVTSQKIATALRANPYYLHYFKRVLEGRIQRTDALGLEAGIVQLGMQNSRNIVISLQAYRSVLGGNPALDDKGQLEYRPEELLKYAVKTEELLSIDRSGYSDTAYAAGLIFDLLSLMTQDLGERKVKVQTYLAQTYLQGLRTAKIAMELAQDLPDFSYRKFLFSACLIHNVGKVAMAILDPEYLTWLDEVRRQELPRTVRHFAEGYRFGMTHASFSAMICHTFKLFQPIEKAILHHHDPHRVKNQKNIYELACLISLSTSMANQFRKVSSIQDPIIATWRGLELKDFKITNRTIVTASSRIHI